ncbi:MAG: ribonuclease domain-containing protein [Eubacteriales bacterium]|nr:ribonuclease domain-containing protein [Eubacteriales bacterium]
MKKLKNFLLVLLSVLVVVFGGYRVESYQQDNQNVETEQTVSGETEAVEEETADISDESEQSSSELSVSGEDSQAASTVSVSEDGTYTSKEEVALYIHTYGHLPDNFISKTKARKAGWDSKEGNLDEVLPGMSIGGSEFKNYDGQLPDAAGRTWTECDINYTGGYRGAERIVFSNDGLIYYTGDHYKTFEQLY